MILLDRDFLNLQCSEIDTILARRFLKFNIVRLFTAFAKYYQKDIDLFNEILNLIRYIQKKLRWYIVKRVSEEIKYRQRPGGKEEKSLIFCDDP